MAGSWFPIASCLSGGAAKKIAGQRPWAIHRTTIRQSGQGAPAAGAAGCRRRSGAATPQAGAEPAQRTPHDVIVALQAEAADLKDRLLQGPRGGGEHPQAVGAREGGDRQIRGHQLARDIVNVGDNFQRAIDAVPAGAAEQDAGPQELPRRRDHDRARAAQRARAPRHQARPAHERALQSAPASGRDGDRSAATCRAAPSCRCSRRAS